MVLLSHFQGVYRAILTATDHIPRQRARRKERLGWLNCSWRFILRHTPVELPNGILQEKHPLSKIESTTKTANSKAIWPISASGPTQASGNVPRESAMCPKRHIAGHCRPTSV